MVGNPGSFIGIHQNRKKGENDHRDLINFPAADNHIYSADMGKETISMIKLLFESFPFR